MKEFIKKHGVSLLGGFSLGLVLGIILGCFLVSGIYRDMQASANVSIEEVESEDVIEETVDTENEVTEEIEEIESTDEGEVYLESECGLWLADTIYVEGNLVQYNNKIYKAKWWTQGDTPGTNEVWEVTTIQVEDLLTSDDLVAEQSINIVNTSPAGDDDFKVVAYYPSWKSDGLDKLDYSVVTHVIYAFAIPTAEGGLMELENAALAEFIIEEAHANERKVLLAVGGWSYQDVPLESTFMEATDSPEKIIAFGDAIIAMCNQYGFDGIDIDWEHPRYDGTSVTQYETLMLYLAEELHSQGKILTSAVLSGVTAEGQVYYDAAAHTDAVLGAVDWINVMAYDGGDGSRHSTYEFAVDCGTYWSETRGLDASKVVLGVPFYARPSWASYEDILAADSLAYSTDVSNYNGMEAYYNGIDTITAKTNYAQSNLGGIMIWEITQDTTIAEYSLLQAIKQAIAS